MKISKNQYLTISSPISLIVRSIGLALLIQSVISLPLWMGNGGTFPMVSLFERTSFELSTDIQPILGLIYFGLLVSLIVSPEKYFNYLLPFFITIVIFMLFQDVNRLQVWVYLYIFILTIVYISIKTKDPNILFYIRFILGGVYFWSGFHKFNIHYAETFEWMISGFPFLKKLGTSTIAINLSACIELLLGILLVLKIQKRITFIGIVLMHGCIILSLLSLDWNSVVYMWNIEMVFLVYLTLFMSDDKIRYISSKPYYAIVMIIWLLPSLYIYDKIPACFSFNMYSGRDIAATIYFHSKDASIFPKKLEIPLEKFKGQEPIGLDVDYWCIKVNGVPSFAHENTYIRLNQILCKAYSMKSYGGIILKKYPRDQPPIEESYPCE